MAGKIFINYRRGDDPGFAQALFGRLEQAFSHDQLFMDVDNIAPGLDFVRVLAERVAECDVLLAVIGKGWIDARNANGARRLDDPDDFVRIEIGSALGQDKRVIPVLVGDAQMPRRDELPEELQPLVRRNAVRLTHERFRADTQGLVKALERSFEEMEAARQTEAEAARRAEAEAERQRQQAVAEEERERQEAEAARRAAEETARLNAERDARERAAAERRRQDAAAKQRAAEELALAKAKRAGTAAAFDAFLAVHPSSDLAEEAQNLKALLLARDDAHRRAMASEDPELLESFLATYRKGDDADQVRARLRVLSPSQGWQLSKLAVVVPAGAAVVLLAGAGIVWFALKSPSPSLSTASPPTTVPTPAVVAEPARPAASSIAPSAPRPDETAWALLKDTTDEETLRRFVRQYADSPFLKEAETRIAALAGEKAAGANAAANTQAAAKAKAEAAPKAPDQPAEAAAAAKLEPDRAGGAAAGPAIAAAQPAAVTPAAKAVPVPPPGDQQVAMIPPSDAGQIAVTPPALSGPALIIQIEQELQRIGCYSGKLDGDWTSSGLKQSIAKYVKAASLASVPDLPTTDFLVSIRGQSSRVCPLRCARTEKESNGNCVAKTCPGGQKLDSEGNCESIKQRTVSAPAPAAAPRAAAEDQTRGFSNFPIPGKQCRRIGMAGSSGYKCE